MNNPWIFEKQAYSVFIVSNENKVNITAVIVSSSDTFFADDPV